MTLRFETNLRVLVLAGTCRSEGTERHARRLEMMLIILVEWLSFIPRKVVSPLYGSHTKYVQPSMWCYCTIVL